MADTCRSCDAPIEWAITTKGSRIPLDVDERDDGNIRLEDGVARVVTPGLGNRVSHFASCPNGPAHRRRNRARR